MSVINRHCLLSHDGIESTTENPFIKKEYFYVVSTDLQHDHYLAHSVRSEIKQYMTSIGYECDTMHIFMDECASV